MAAAAAFCFQIVLDPSEFKSAHNFPLKLRVRFASERADTANATNPPQEKLAAKLYSENTSAEIQQICTTRSTHIGQISALILPGVMLPRTHARAPDDRHKSAAARICYIVSFAREQSYFVTSQNDAEKFSSPPYLKMTKRAALSGAFFPETQFLMWFHWIRLFSSRSFTVGGVCECRALPHGHVHPPSCEGSFSICKCINFSQCLYGAHFTSTGPSCRLHVLKQSTAACRAIENVPMQNSGFALKLTRRKLFCYTHRSFTRSENKKN